MLPLVRRVRRLGLRNISQVQRWLSGPNIPKKHIKIDDEESLQDDHKYRPNLQSTYIRMIKMALFSLFALLILLFLIGYTIYKPPLLLIRSLQWKYPDVLFHIPLPPTKRVVALTLDDAPSSETAKILDLLKAYGAKATFFVIGKQIASHPGILERMHAEGHEIGNHAWADEPSFKLPLAELQQQIEDVEALLPPNQTQPGAETPPKYFRPGSGFFHEKMVKKVKSMGYRLVLGSIYPHDPQIPKPSLNAKHVLSMLRPGGIIIMHDRRSYSAEQVELVLKGLSEKGWKAESLGEVLSIAKGQHSSVSSERAKTSKISVR
ncbi:hypothetical protein B7494_g3088 [Chlorociboria aeruginascens]|nr:hypothetical protein B7494_g3088 [Chlorociboria aeruginascens]